jgi:hypothetical protein
VILEGGGYCYKGAGRGEQEEGHGQAEGIAEPTSQDAKTPG